MRHHTPLLLALAALALTPAYATNFSVTAGQTVTSGQTLGSGSGQTGSVAATGTLSVSGSTVAVTISGASATLTNSGTIAQTGTGRAIRDNTGVANLTVTNNVGAIIQTADADVIQMNKSPASVTFNNYGTLTSLNASKGGSQAIDFNAILSGSNIFNNYATGIAQAAEADAVRPGVNGVVNNDGTIKATSTTGSSSDGIDAQTNTGLVITNAATIASGLIEGARHGITGGNSVADINGNPTVANGAYAMSVTNNTGGTIQGDNGSGINIDGLNGNEVVTIANHGTITGKGVTADGDGVDVDGLVNLTNTGTIKSLSAFNDTSEGVTVGGGTIVNSGTIEGSIDPANGNTGTGRGITIAGIDKYTDTNNVDHIVPVQAPYAATAIANSGLIKGDSDSGIAFTSQLASGFSHTIDNQSGGTIQGGGTLVAAIVTAADAVTINNAGTIDGSSSGKAIAGGAGNLTINVTGGSAAILGDIVGGSGTNTLTIDPGVGHSFSHSGAIGNFASIGLLSGTTTLADTVSLAGGSHTLTVANAATLTPGLATLSLTSGALAVQAGGTLSFTLGGAAAGSGYSQLVFGSVNSDTLTLAAGAQLSLQLANGFTPTANEQFVLVDVANASSAIAGTFSGLAEGGFVTVGSTTFAVSYVGGTGNDLTLTAVPEPAATAALVGAVAGLGALVWRRRSRARA